MLAFNEQALTVTAQAGINGTGMIPRFLERFPLDFFLVAPRLPREDEGYTDLRSRDELEEYLLGLAREKFRAQLAQFGDHSEDLLRYVVLSTIDERWKDHLYDLDGLKASIGFRGWGQKDPLIEYKQEAYSMFVDLMGDIFNTFTERFFRARWNSSATAGWSGSCGRTWSSATTRGSATASTPTTATPAGSRPTAWWPPATPTSSPSRRSGSRRSSSPSSAR